MWFQSLFILNTYTHLYMQKFIPRFIWSLNESRVKQNDFVIEVAFTDPPAVIHKAI